MPEQERVSEMPEAMSLGLLDMIMIIQDGVSKYIKSSNMKVESAVRSDVAATAVDVAAGDVSSKIANTAFVAAAIAAFKAWLLGAAPSTLDQINEIATALGNDPNFTTTMMTALGLKAPLFSPALTGTPTAPTATPGTNNTQLANTAFVTAAVNRSASSVKIDAFEYNPISGSSETFSVPTGRTVLFAITCSSSAARGDAVLNCNHTATTITISTNGFNYAGTVMYLYTD